eukprot:6382176-Amphidinium_carterae.1
MGVKPEVLQHLAKKDDKQAVKFIAALLDDSDSDVRRTSIQALVDVRGLYTPRTHLANCDTQGSGLTLAISPA